MTTGSQGGIAFRVQDKNNCFLAAPWTSTSVRLYRVANGQVSTVSTQTISTVNWGEPHDWYLRADGEDLDLAVYVGGTWYFVFDSGTTGQGKLSGGSHEGAIGLGTTGESTDPVVCDTFTYGYDPDEDGSVTQVIGEDVFDGSALTVEPAYDAAGNLTDDGVYQYVYDAWNRLVQVKRKGGSQPVVGTYRYDGLGHRVYKKVENSGDMNREEYFYYNQGWQLLEIDSADNVARQQFVWGTNYIDEAVCMDVDTGTDGNCTDGSSRHFFYCQDANWNVVALREGASVVERYEYDPYGTVRIYRGSATPGAAEQRTVTGQSLKWLAAGLPENAILYAGYFYDSVPGQYQERNREQRPELERWMQPDGSGCTKNPNLYEYARSQPLAHADPQGLTECYISNGGDLPPPPPTDPLLMVYGCGQCGPMDEAVRRANAALHSPGCWKWFYDHGYKKGDSYIVSCHSKWFKPQCWFTPAWTLPGAGIGFCNNWCCMPPVGIASLLLHEAAHHYCPLLLLGGEACANEAQKECTPGLIQ